MSRSHVFKERSFSRDFYCRVRKFDSSAYFDIHVHVFKNIKKIFSYDTLLRPGYIVSTLGWNNKYDNFLLDYAVCVKVYTMLSKY